MQREVDGEIAGLLFPREEKQAVKLAAAYAYQGKHAAAEDMRAMGGYGGLPDDEGDIR